MTPVSLSCHLFFLVFYFSRCPLFMLCKPFLAVLKSLASSVPPLSVNTEFLLRVLSPDWIKWERDIFLFVDGRVDGLGDHSDWPNTQGLLSDYRDI